MSEIQENLDQAIPEEQVDTAAGEGDFWKGELTRLDSNDTEQVPFWRVPEGKHTVRFGELGATYSKTYDEREVEKQIFKVEVLEGDDWTPYVWGIAKGSTRASLYGQLAQLGAARDGLEGHETTVVVIGEGKQKRVTIPEVFDL